MTDIRFVASAHPHLPAGLYSVRVGQRLQAGPLDARFGALAGAKELHFDASGPRTDLGPGAVASRFPIPGDRGDHAGTLAHVVLNDPMLPWLRSPWAGGGDVGAPWLALILLAGEEIDAVGRRTAKISELGRDIEPGERGDSVVALLKLSADMAARVLPTPAELPYLAHVRQLDGPEPTSHAVIVCNRLPPAATRLQVHLVSLEDVASGQAVELVSLDHWEFESVHDGPGFRDLALALAHNCGPLRQEAGVGAADEQLRRGVVPMRFRGSMAWYRGPLAPALDDPSRRHLAAAFDSDVPARADELLLFDEHLQMVDASYAVAWDLGRALILADGHTALALDDWFRARRRQARNGGQLQGLADHRNAEPRPPADALAWFESLLDLRLVPTRHLVPDPDRLVPLTEARWNAGGVERRASGRLAFFVVDPMWVTIMGFGAASVCLVTAAERRDLAKMNMQGPAMRGFALRSELVRWDDFRVAVWADGAEEAPLETIIRDVGADLRLVMVKSDSRRLTVELSRAPHGLHFGIEETGTPLRKVPRDQAGRPLTDAVTVPVRGGHGTIAIADLAQALGVSDAAAFARHMVLGSPSLRLDLHLEEGA